MTDQNFSPDCETLTDEEHEALLLMCGHAVGPPLSPATHAVLDAYTDAPVSGRIALAAALRAAVMHLRSEEYAICNGSSYAMMIEVDDLLDLATELETND